MTKYINETLFSECLYFFFKCNGFTYMKIGQWLASRPDFLTPKVRQRLKKLHDEAPTHSTRYTNEILAHDFPLLNLKVLASDLIGSGCVAQVYKAKYKEKLVAIKVLHPRIRETIEKDLNLIEKCTKLFIGDSFFTQFKIDVKSQLNMNNEHKNLTILHNKNKYFKYLYIPQVYFSTTNVIIEEYVKGEKITDTISNNDLVFKLMLIASKMTLSDSFFHADLHPGNILYANKRIVLLDGGMCRCFSTREHKNLSDLLYEVFYKKNYNKACDLILTRTNNDKVIDKAKFKKDMLQCIKDGGKLTNAMQIIRIHRVNLDYGYSSLVMTMVCLDGILKQLSENPYNNGKRILYFFGSTGSFLKRYFKLTN